MCWQHDTTGMDPSAGEFDVYILEGSLTVVQKHPMLSTASPNRDLFR